MKVLQKTMKYKIEKEWEFNYLNIYNYRKVGKLTPLIEHIKKTAKSETFNIAEFGVYKGAQTLGIAMLLKEIGLSGYMHGFDSFSGFPPIFSNYDSLDRFDDQFLDKKIKKDQYDDILKLKEYKFLLSGVEPSTKIISSSGDFSDSNYELIVKKIDFFKLDNIILHPGNFSETLTSNIDKNFYSAAIIDCDLHDSYKISLEYIWPRLLLGGIVYLDEYYSLKFPGAKICVDKFLEDKKYQIDFFQLGESFPRCYIKKLT